MFLSMNRNNFRRLFLPNLILCAMRDLFFYTTIHGILPCITSTWKACSVFLYDKSFKKKIAPLLYQNVFTIIEIFLQFMVKLWLYNNKKNCVSPYVHGFILCYKRNQCSEYVYLYEIIFYISTKPQLKQVLNVGITGPYHKENCNFSALLLFPCRKEQGYWIQLNDMTLLQQNQ